MTNEERMSNLEKAFGANDDLVRELRHAVTVTAHLEARQGKVIANLVSGIGEFLRRSN